MTITEADPQLSHLFAPGRIGALEIKNRIVMAPMTNGAIDEGYVTDRQIDYFGREAQGAIRGTAAPFGFISSVGGLLFDLKGDYMLAFSVFVAASVSASLAALMARPPQIVVLRAEG